MASRLRQRLRETGKHAEARVTEAAYQAVHEQQLHMRTVLEAQQARRARGSDNGQTRDASKRRSRTT